MTDEATRAAAREARRARKYARLRAKQMAAATLSASSASPSPSEEVLNGYTGKEAKTDRDERQRQELKREKKRKHKERKKKMKAARRRSATMGSRRAASPSGSAAAGSPPALPRFEPSILEEGNGDAATRSFTPTPSPSRSGSARRRSTTFAARTPPERTARVKPKARSRHTRQRSMFVGSTGRAGAAGGVEQRLRDAEQLLEAERQAFTSLNASMDRERKRFREVLTEVRLELDETKDKLVRAEDRVRELELSAELGGAVEEPKFYTPKSGSDSLVRQLETKLRATELELFAANELVQLAEAEAEAREANGVGSAVVQKLEGQLSKARSERDDAQRKVQQLEARVGELEAKNTDYRVRISRVQDAEELKSTTASLTSRLKQKEEENKRLRKAMRDRPRSPSSADDRSSAAFASLTKRFGALERKHEDLVAEHEELQDDKRRTENQLLKAQSDLEERNKDLQHADEELQRLHTLSALSLEQHHKLEQEHCELDAAFMDLVASNTAERLFLEAERELERDRRELASQLLFVEQGRTKWLRERYDQQTRVVEQLRRTSGERFLEVEAIKKLLEHERGLQLKRAQRQRVQSPVLTPRSPGNRLLVPSPMASPPPAPVRARSLGDTSKSEKVTAPPPVRRRSSSALQLWRRMTRGKEESDSEGELEVLMDPEDEGEGQGEDESDDSSLLDDDALSVSMASTAGTGVSVHKTSELRALRTWLSETLYGNSVAEEMRSLSLHGQYLYHRAQSLGVSVSHPSIVKLAKEFAASRVPPP